MTVMFFATRDAENPKNDENAAMAHVSIAKSFDFDEVKAALIDYINKEVVWLAKSLRPDESSDWCRDRIQSMQNAVVTIAQWQDSIFGFDPGNWAQKTIVTDGLVWRMVRTER